MCINTAWPCCKIHLWRLYASPGWNWWFKWLGHQLDMLALSQCSNYMGASGSWALIEWAMAPMEAAKSIICRGLSNTPHLIINTTHLQSLCAQNFFLNVLNRLTCTAALHQHTTMRANGKQFISQLVKLNLKNNFNIKWIKNIYMCIQHLSVCWKCACAKVVPKTSPPLEPGLGGRVCFYLGYLCIFTVIHFFYYYFIYLFG